MFYFTSDLHLGHKGILKFEPQFNSVAERDELIIENYNKTVTKKDTCVILGDVSMGMQKDKLYDTYLKHLNGKKIIILGNHDRTNLRALKDPNRSILEVTSLYNLNVNGLHIICSHYPIMFWDRQHYGSFHLFGHLHNATSNQIYNKTAQTLKTAMNLPEWRAINVGCMLHDYTPQTLDQLIDKANLTRTPFSAPRHPNNC